MEDLLPSQIIEEFTFNNNEEWLPILSDADMEMFDLNYLNWTGTRNCVDSVHKCFKNHDLNLQQYQFFLHQLRQLYQRYLQEEQLDRNMDFRGCCPNEQRQPGPPRQEECAVIVVNWDLVKAVPRKILKEDWALLTTSSQSKQTWPMWNPVYQAPPRRNQTRLPTDGNDDGNDGSRRKWRGQAGPVWWKVVWKEDKKPEKSNTIESNCWLVLKN